jgi:hypothetical protein
VTTFKVNAPEAYLNLGTLPLISTSAIKADNVCCRLFINGVGKSNYYVLQSKNWCNICACNACSSRVYEVLISSSCTGLKYRCFFVDMQVFKATLVVAGSHAGQYPRVNKTRTVRRTVREIMQIIAVNQALTFGRWVIEFLVLASFFRHAFLHLL